MQPTVARTILAPILVAALTLASGCSFSSARYKATTSAQVPHVPETRLRVESANGGVRVESGQVEEVQIVAEVKAQTQERADSTQISADRTDDGTLVVGVLWPDGQRLSSEGCSFRITLPSSDGADVRTSNGGIVLVGLSGPVFAQTSNGSIELQRHNGDGELRTSNGRIAATDVLGVVSAGTSNGRIELRRVLGPVAAETSNGGVTVELLPESTGPARLSASNGPIDLVVGPSFAGELDARTSNGSVHMNLGSSGAAVSSSGKHDARARFAGDGEMSRLTTSNGSITVSSRAD